MIHAITLYLCLASLIQISRTGNTTTEQVEDMIHKSEVLLATDSSITMYDCVTENATFRHCECHWTVHVEEDSMVNAMLYLNITETGNPGCIHCHLRYGYIQAASNKYKVEVKNEVCGLNKIIQYSVKASMWLEFKCFGSASKSHRSLWDNVRRYNGFILKYSVTDGPRSWELSTIFALIVMVLSAIAVCSIGFMVYRSCKSQSLQRNILQTRQRVKKNSRLRKFLRQPSQHKAGLHEQFISNSLRDRRQQHLRSLPALSVKCVPVKSTPQNSTFTDYESFEATSEDNSRQRRKTEIKEPIRTNHTYISIHPDSSDPERDESVDLTEEKITPSLRQHHLAPSNLNKNLALQRQAKFTKVSVRPSAIVYQNIKRKHVPVTANLKPSNVPLGSGDSDSGLNYSSGHALLNRDDLQKPGDPQRNVAYASNTCHINNDTTNTDTQQYPTGYILDSQQTFNGGEQLAITTTKRKSRAVPHIILTKPSTKRKQTKSVDGPSSMKTPLEHNRASRSASLPRDFTHSPPL